MILFLDFDGVLHPTDVYLKKGRPTLHGEGELFMWAPQLIEALAPYPHVKIVLSTSWVRVRGFTRTRRALPEALRARVIGATWHSGVREVDFFSQPYSSRLTATPIWYDKATRFQQIERYVSLANVQQWVAIDDLHEHSKDWNAAYEAHLVKTNHQRGLSDPVALANLQSILLSSENN
jgi:hypothetical protein